MQVKLVMFRAQLDRDVSAAPPGTVRLLSPKAAAMLDELNALLKDYNDACVKESLEYGRMANTPVGLKTVERELELSRKRLGG